MKRRLARETVVKILYQMEFNDEDVTEQLETFFKLINDGNALETVFFPESSHDIDIENKDRDFISGLVKGIYEYKPSLDNLIKEHSVGWKISRIPAVELSILRLAIYEINYCEDIPINVSINESVELAKKYCGDQAPPYINAVLGKIARSNAKTLQDDDLECTLE